MLLQKLRKKVTCTQLLTRRRDNIIYTSFTLSYMTNFEKVIKQKLLFQFIEYPYVKATPSISSHNKQTYESTDFQNIPFYAFSSLSISNELFIDRMYQFYVGACLIYSCIFFILQTYIIYIITRRCNDHYI